MAKTHSDSIIYIIILGSLLIEIVYLLISIIWYNHNNPIYLSFWAVCCRKQVKNQLPTLSHVQSNSRSSSNSSLSPNSSHSHLQIPAKTYMNKLDWFIFYGLDTILHSILLPFYLISLLIYICIRIKIESVNISIINGNTSWFKHLSLCSYIKPTAVIFPIISHYILLIFISSRALRLEWFRFDATKCNKLYPLILNIWFIICFVLNIIPYFNLIYKPSDDGKDCVHNGMEMIITILMLAAVMLNIALCMIAFLRPFWIQKSILKRLSKQNKDVDKSSKDILQLLNAINKITKRVCVLGTVAITFAVISLSISLYGDIWYFSAVYFIIMVHLYFILCFTFKDWKIKTTSCCVYPLGRNYHHEQNIQANESKLSNTNSMEMQIH